MQVEVTLTNKQTGTSVFSTREVSDDASEADITQAAGSAILGLGRLLGNIEAGHLHGRGSKHEIIDMWPAVTR